MNNGFQRKKIFTRILPLLINPITLFCVDPFLPKLISFYLSRSLRQLKSSGVIGGYKLEVQRAGRLCYKVTLHVLAEKKETNRFLINYISKLFNQYLSENF
jgi:hypothetical protein